MLTSRKGLISNLNYVNLQQVSFGGRLSLRPEVTTALLSQDTGLKDVNGCLHQWKDNSEVLLVDANSNDPSVPCQCCDQNSTGHKEALCYSSDDNLESILCEDYLSPEIPLSPLSPTSPSTDSSSSSDFTLEESPDSMYYKEYAQEELQTPDQQPDIIPLDMETEGMDPAMEDFTSPALEESMSPALEESISPALEESMSPALEESMSPALEESMSPALEHSMNSALTAAARVTPENVINNNTEQSNVPFIDWSSDTLLDGNCNSIPGPQPPYPLSSASRQVTRSGEPIVDEEPLPGSQDYCSQTPKKTITSFHELAQKRRKSGGQLPAPPKKDKSDWLIIFSPDTEQPPVNELTASAFYNDVPLPEGKEVTTFRELRYRNALNKQSGQQGRANKGPQGSAEGARDSAGGHQITEAQRDVHGLQITDTQRDVHGLQITETQQDVHSLQITETRRNVYGLQIMENRRDTGLPIIDAKDLQTTNAVDREGCGSGPDPVPKTCPPIPPPRLRSQRARKSAAQVNPQSMGAGQSPNGNSAACVARRECQENEAGARPQRLADGADRRGVEVYGALPPSRLFLQFSTNLTPPPALPPLSSTPEASVPPPQSWYRKFPVRLSPIGALSPPQRALLPLLDSPDLAVLLSPLFPRYRSRNPGPHGAPTAYSPDSGVEEAEPLMADGGDGGVQRGKKSLLVAIGSEVDKIISHFNGSRKQVQKAQLGDSRLNPGLGYLIAEGLCPALTALLADGLKPFQKDVIVGRRRVSPWHLVEASAKSGPHAIQLLFCNVGRLQQLRDPQRRFNAFIFGLLNTKQLETWLAHLLHSYDQLTVLYTPTGFLPLAATSHPSLREELLLTVQPLSALTFHTDLLFEHHHLPLQDPPTPQGPPTPQCPARDGGVPAFQHFLDLGGWLAHNLGGAGEASCSRRREGVCPPGEEELRQKAAPPVRDWSRNWWGHLTQASRIYAPGKKETFTFTPFQKEGGPEGERCKPRPRGLEEADTPADPSRSAAWLKSGSDPTARKQADTSPAPEEKTGWFGPLFGNGPGHSGEPEGQKSRRPSSWLPPNVNVLDLIRKRPPPQKDPNTPQAEEEAPRRPERSLRALCDHSGSGDAQLSFQKGDVLQLLGTVDDDWIQCRRGSVTGLVPVAYTSLIL
ncbi:AP-4 complex accessory subunit RUSC1 [Gastrophryne carolinensis]